MKKHFLFLLFPALLLLSGTPFTAAFASGDNILADPELRDIAAWALTPEHHFLDNPDSPGTHILVAGRTERGDYYHASREIDLPPGIYEFTAEIKTELSAGVAFAYVEYFDRDGEYLGGVYPKTNARDWTEVSFEMAVPSEAVRGKFGFGIFKGSTGQAWLRHAAVMPKIFYSTYLLQPAQPGALRPGEQEIELGVYDSGSNLAGQLRAELYRDGQLVDHFSTAVSRERAHGRLKFSEAGAFTLTTRLLDAAGNILETTDIPLQVLPADAVEPANAAILDRAGRLLVDGKKFFPLGLFLNTIDARTRQLANPLETDLQIIGESPFNTILPYSFLLYRRGDHADDIARVNGFLDEAAKNNLKVILSVKDIREEKTWWTDFAGGQGERDALRRIVTAFQSHPALLAYYTFDEDPPQLRDLHRGRRNWINRLDPWHPTLMVFYQASPMSLLLGGTADICAADPYPLGKHSEPESLRNCQDWIEINRRITRTSVDSAGAMWICPQIFNFGHYRLSAADGFAGHEEYIYPTETQMHAQTHLALIGGAKGILMYSYFDLFAGPDPEEFDKRWPAICRVAALTRELGDYVLGDRIAPEVEIELQQGEVLARRFIADDGREAVLVVALGPGPAEADIVLPSGRWQSRLGRTAAGKNNRWHFSGQEMCSDVLFLDNVR